MKYTIVKDECGSKYTLFKNWNDEKEEIALMQGKTIIGTIKLTNIDSQNLTEDEFNEIKKDVKKYVRY